MVRGVGIVGTGAIARHHAKVLQDAVGLRVAAVLSRSAAAAASMAADYGCKGYTDQSAFLADPAVDIVAVCTPSGAHMEVSVAAAQAGKHLLIEKPLEISLERCDAIINAAARHNVLLGGIFQSRFFAAAGVLKDAIAAGRFGRLALGDAYVKWWRSQEYYDLGGWKGTQALDGGGALMNQGIHAIDLLQWYMGPVDAVQAFTAVRGHERIEVEDTAVAALQFANGALGVIEGSTAIHPGFLKRIEISGTGGSAVLEEECLKVWTFAAEQPQDAEIRTRFGQSSGSGGGASDPAVALTTPHRLQYEDFAAAIAGGTAPRLDGVEARKAVAIIVAIYESARSGRRVAVSQ